MTTRPLGHLLPRWGDDPAFRAALSGRGDVVLPDAVRPFFVAGLAAATEGCVLAVVPSDPDADALAAAAGEFCEAALLASWDVLPYEGLSPDARSSARRIEALRLLARTGGCRVVVASARGLIQKPAPGVAAMHPVRVRPGGTLDREELTGRLVGLGYERTDIAAEPGTFAVRGGVVDVFGAQETRVARIELFGDDIESLRWVDPESQLSVSDAAEAVFVPRTELPPSPDVRTRAADAVKRLEGRPWFADVADRLERIADGAVPEGAESVLPLIWDPARDSLGAQLPSDVTVVIFDPKRTFDEAAMAVEQEEELAALWTEPARLQTDPSIREPVAPRTRHEEMLLYQPLETVLDAIDAPVRHAGALTSDEDAPASDARPWEPGMSPRALLERCRNLRADGYDLVFCALPHEAPAVGTRLAEEELAGSAVVASSLHQGFVAPSLRLA
ncbi:MAG TPA: hypothetical protein VM840_11065, partial [Actinomycetota bacterium]|nr:hypothetical protein [Actinomycetota bacterium]